MHEAVIAAQSALAEYVLPAPVAGRAPEANRAGVETIRVVGPGRRERAYQERVSALAGELERERAQRNVLLAELSADRAALQQSREALTIESRIERGCQKRIDRLETLLEERTQALLDSERQHKRLALVLGALQRENQALRAELAPALPRTAGSDSVGDLHPGEHEAFTAAVGSSSDRRASPARTGAAPRGFLARMARALSRRR